MVVGFKSQTIRRRIKIIFIVIICFITMMAFGYGINIFELKSDLTIIEDYYTLANNVLELRRFEKNLIFDLGKTSYNHDQVLHYLDEVEQNSTHLAEKIVPTIGEQEYLQFTKDIQKYKENLADGKITTADAKEIRARGRSMVNFTDNLMDLKRQEIHTILHNTLVGFLIFPAGGFILVLVVFFMQTKSILHRLAFIQNSTDKLANGHWEPIEDETSREDEISNLIEAFNQMVKETKLKQKQLIQSEKLASIGIFSSGVAHELNNPLNNISLTVDTLQEEFDYLAASEAKEMLANIVIQTERASNVVRNLLDFSRDTSAVPEDEIDIRKVIEGTVTLIGNQLKLENIQLDIDIPDNLSPVRGDFQHLQQVFLNLFLNSIYSISDSGLVTIDAREDSNSMIRIDFSDTGCGIPADKLETVFDPFFTTKPLGDGTGLGLSIVHNIIWKHNGFMEVKSKTGRGTTFSIFLPVADRRIKEQTGNENATSSRN
jgi:two-component system NtrC family sensor kinase